MNRLALSILALLPPAQQSGDLSKREVELPLERALPGGTSSEVQPRRDATKDYGKSLVEFPLERALPGGTASVVPDREAVKPGLVRWHADFAAACAAAESSHKPVLLFQLLGKLDEEFC
jgi:hypothetical protein